MKIAVTITRMVEMPCGSVDTAKVYAMKTEGVMVRPQKWCNGVAYVNINGQLYFGYDGENWFPIK